MPPCRSVPNRSELEPKDTISSSHFTELHQPAECWWWGAQTWRIVWFAMQKRRARSLGHATLDFNSIQVQVQVSDGYGRCAVVASSLRSGLGLVFGLGIATSGGVLCACKWYWKGSQLDALLIPSRIWTTELEVLLICRWKAVQINHKAHNKEVLHADEDVGCWDGAVQQGAWTWAWVWIWASGTDHGSRCHVSVKMTRPAEGRPME